jgi:Ca2+-binding RTX toxin-like protein
VGIGGDFADLFEGGSGADQLNGNGGDDVFLASSGADGDDTIDGGAGSDIYDASAAGATVIIDLDEGLASGTSVGNDGLVNIENATGSAFGDTLTGDGLANILKGLSGTDILSGAGGNDTLIGGDGIDTMTGGGGRDVLYGEADGDADVFDYNSVTESGIAGLSRDRIFGFEDGLDKINLHDIDAMTFKKGNQDFTFITGAFTSAGGQIRATLTAGGNTLIQINTDHDTAAEMSILLIGTPTITAADFVL